MANKYGQPIKSYSSVVSSLHSSKSSEPSPVDVVIKLLNKMTRPQLFEVTQRSDFKLYPEMGDTVRICFNNGMGGCTMIHPLERKDGKNKWSLDPKTNKRYA